MCRVRAKLRDNKLNIPKAFEPKIGYHAMYVDKDKRRICLVPDIRGSFMVKPCQINSCTKQVRVTSPEITEQVKKLFNLNDGDYIYVGVSENKVIYIYDRKE